MCCSIDRCGGCRHSCRRFRTGAEGYGIFIGHFCIAAKSHAVLRRYRSVVPQHHSTISGNRGIASHRIGIIRFNGILITESTCRISFDRTSRDVLDLIAVGFCRFRNGGRSDCITAANGIGIIPIHGIFRADRRGRGTGYGAVRHIQTDCIRIADSCRFIPVSLRPAAESQRLIAPAPCHDTDTGAGNPLRQCINANRRRTCTIRLGHHADGHTGIPYRSGIHIILTVIDSCTSQCRPRI